MRLLPHQAESVIPAVLPGLSSEGTLEALLAGALGRLTLLSRR